MKRLVLARLQAVCNGGDLVADLGKGFGAALLAGVHALVQICSEVLHPAAHQISDTLNLRGNRVHVLYLAVFAGREFFTDIIKP